MGGAGLTAHGPGYAFGFTRGGVDIGLLHAQSGAGLALRLRLLGRSAAPIGVGVDHARIAAFSGDSRVVSTSAFRRVVIPQRLAGCEPGHSPATAARCGMRSTFAPGRPPPRSGWRTAGFAAPTSTRAATCGSPSPATLIDRRPIAYQERAGRRLPVPVHYVLHATPGAFGFALGAHDARLPVTIDPTLVYSTYLGGSNYDYLNSATSAPDGTAYVTGETFSRNFPTTPGAFQPSPGPGDDAFVARFDPTGSRLIYSTLLGGKWSDRGSHVALGTDGSAYVVGITASPDFPTTPGAYEPHLNGTLEDAFVTKLSPDGSTLDYSTYIGTRQSDDGIRDRRHARRPGYGRGRDRQHVPRRGRRPGVRRRTSDGSRAGPSS